MAEEALHVTIGRGSSETENKPNGAETPPVPKTFLADLGSRILTAYSDSQTNGRLDPVQFINKFGEDVTEYQKKIAEKGAEPDAIHIPQIAKQAQVDNFLVFRWAERIGEAASSVKDGGESFKHLLDRSLESIKRGQLPEITPLTAGSVSWKTTFTVKQPILDSLLKLYDTQQTDATETNADLKELIKSVADLVPDPEKSKAIVELLGIQTTQQPRLQANETSSGGGLTPEFPKTPEQFATIVREALVDFVDTDVLENITHGWKDKIAVTIGGLRPYALGSKEIESNPVAKTPISITDSAGKPLETIPLFEYLRREVDAAEATTLSAYMFKTCNVKDKVSSVVGIEIPNKALDALGKIMTPDLKANIGDDFGKVFKYYVDISKIDREDPITKTKKPTGLGYSGDDENFLRMSGVSRDKERNLRKWVRETQLPGYSNTDAQLIEGLALNLVYAWGYGADASKTGTMSATERATWLDRVFQTNIWRGKKVHSGGPRSTVDQNIFPDQLLIPAPELYVTVEGTPPVYRTLKSKLNDAGYRFRDAGFLAMGEIDHRFKVAILDAMSFFEDITSPPDAIKATWGGFHKITEHAENAMNVGLLFSPKSGLVEPKAYPNGVDKVSTKIADAFAAKKGREAAIATFKGLHREAKNARMFNLAGEIQGVCKNVLGVVVDNLF